MHTTTAPEEKKSTFLCARRRLKIEKSESTISCAKGTYAAVIKSGLVCTRAEVVA